MCQDCGCLETDKVTINGKNWEEGHHHPAGHDHSHGHHGHHPGHHHHHDHHHHDHGHDHEHDHAHHHDHGHSQEKGQQISIKTQILTKNNQIAQHNREHFAETRLLCLNFISAPGSGKTSLLERMIRDQALQRPVAVIEGDQQTQRDADRIRQTGAQAVQINTGAACHLDAQMVHLALHQLELEPGSLLVIENVGNMVCPTAYDLGEAAKVAVISSTEGEDKPIKYPDLLLAAKVLLINKIDLIPHLDFDLEQCIAFSKKVNPALQIFPVSAKTGEGLEAFYQWIAPQLSA